MPEHVEISTQNKTNAVKTSNNLKSTLIIQRSPSADIIQRVQMQPQSLTHAEVMQLQHTIGNRAVMQLFKSAGGLGNEPQTGNPAPLRQMYSINRPVVQAKIGEHDMGKPIDVVRKSDGKEFTAVFEANGKYKLTSKDGEDVDNIDGGDDKYDVLRKVNYEMHEYTGDKLCEQFESMQDARVEKDRLYKLQGEYNILVRALAADAEAGNNAKAQAQNMLDGIDFENDAHRRQFQDIQKYCLKLVEYNSQDMEKAQKFLSPGLPLEHRVDKLSDLHRNISSNNRTIQDKVTTLAARSIAEMPEDKKIIAAREWDEFEDQVTNGWGIYRNSGYKIALRGANNHGEYKRPSSVKMRLNGCGRSITIRGVEYRIQHSDTSGISLHRTPNANAADYIFHLF